jgi:uncharacterized membrane protein YbhN (UPF0104 family)
MIYKKSLKNKNIIKKILITIIIFVSGFILYKHSNQLVYYSKNISWRYAFNICFFQALFLSFAGLAFALLCKTKVNNATWSEWIGLSFIANLLNQILPYRPGLIVRYLYLNKNHQLKLRDYVSINLLFFLFISLIGFIFFSIGMFFLPIDIKNQLTTQYSLPNNYLPITLLIIVFITASVFLFKRFIKKTYKRIFNKQNFKSILNILFMHISLALSFYFCFKALNYPVPFIDTVCITGAVTVASIISLTPGNIGVIETLLGSLTLWWYSDFSIGLAAAIIYRGSNFFSSSIGSGLFFFKLADKIPSRKQIKNWNNQVH